MSFQTSRKYSFQRSWFFGNSIKFHLKITSFQLSKIIIPFKQGIEMVSEKRIRSIFWILQGIFHWNEVNKDILTAVCGSFYGVHEWNLITSEKNILTVGCTCSLNSHHLFMKITKSQILFLLDFKSGVQQIHCNYLLPTECANLAI